MEKPGIRFHLCLFMLLGTALCLFGLDPKRSVNQYVLESWSTDDGLPQSFITAIVQTHDDYIWLGTQDGLVRYNGIRFESFQNESPPLKIRGNLVDEEQTSPPDSLSVPGTDNILSLYEDSAGVLWIGTRNGGIYTRRKKEFRSLSKEVKYKELLDPKYRTLNTRTFCEDKDRALWIGTEKQGIIRIKDERVSFFQLEPDRSVIVSVIYRDSRDHVWVGSENGLYRWEESRFIRHVVSERLPGSNVTALLEDRDHNLWIGTSNGLYRTGGMDPSQGIEETGLKGVYVTALLSDRDNNLWVGTRGMGLYRYSRGRFETRTAGNNRFPSNQVVCLCEDREGSIWVGLAGGGLSRLRDASVVTNIPEDEPRDMWSILQSADGSMWLGTSDGLLQYKNETFRRFRTGRDTIDNHFFSILEDHKERLLVGNRKGMIYFFEHGRFRPHPASNPDENNLVFSLFEDSSHRLWISSRQQGLQCYENGTLTSHEISPGVNAYVFHILETRQGDLWFATDSLGFCRYSGNEFTCYAGAQGTGSDFVWTLYEDSSSNLWVGTHEGGLGLFRDGRITTYNEKNGLYGNTVYRILEDNHGYLWMSSNRGIFRVSIQELLDYADGKRQRIYPTGFGRWDGMLDSECNGGGQHSGWKTREGHLWFPTVYGAAEIDPDHLVSNRIRPPVRIEEVQADDRKVPLDENIEIPAGTRTISFYYAGLSFVAPENVRYKVMIDEVDRDWKEMGNRSVVQYPVRRPGTFTFNVIACNNNQLWNRKGASISFYVRPLFYQTWWFLPLCFFLFCLSMVGLWGIHRMRVRFFKKREKELERLVEEKTMDLLTIKHQLEYANEELQKLSSLDGLTGIANRRQFDKILSRSWRLAMESHIPLSLIMVDIDHFKDYNDIHGHQSGDDCLIRIAEILDTNIRRQGDLAARYGGEEFALIMMDTNAQGALRVAEDLRILVEEEEIHRSRSETGSLVTISLGVATMIPRPDTNETMLIKAADEALYRAKTTGRNRVVVTPV